MYKRKYIKPEIDLSETIIKRSEGGDLTEAKNFVNDWNSKRDPQMKENVQSAVKFPFLEDVYKTILKNSVDSVDLIDFDLQKNDRGAYFPVLHKIALNTDGIGTKIHEVAHASRPKAQEAKIGQLKEDLPYLKPGVKPNNYLDSNREIYARLMALREALKLDPNKKYSLPEIRKMIDKHSEFHFGIPTKDGKGHRIVTQNSEGKTIRDIGSKENLDYNKTELKIHTKDPKQILDRYTPVFIESLINEVADTKKFIPRASKGMSMWDPSIIDWYKNLVGKAGYSEFNKDKMVSTPNVSLPEHRGFVTTSFDGEQRVSTSETGASSEPELAYANAHIDKPELAQIAKPEPQEKPQTAQHVYTNNVNYEGFSKKMQEFLDKVASYGISLRITSGRRAAGDKFSHHQNGDAVDFTPIEGQSWDDLTNSFLDNEELMQYLRQNGINLYDERKSTGSADWTGAHWHVGMDKNTHTGWDNLQASRVSKAQKGVKFIQPDILGMFSSYHDYTTPKELPRNITKYFGKNSDNVRTIIVELKNAGWNDKQIAAYVGNVAAESTGNPKAVNSIGATGLIQRLGDRKEPIRSIPNLDLITQLGYDAAVMSGNVSDQEMSNEWPRRKFRNKFLQGNASVRSLTDNLMKHYIRPAKEEQKISTRKRRQVAQNVYNFLNKK